MGDNQSECIYNILGKQNKKKKGGKFRSRYPYDIAPTGSTFINKNTTRPGVANLAGEYVQFKGGHEFKFATQTFGLPKDFDIMVFLYNKGDAKPNTQEFCRRGAHTASPNCKIIICSINQIFKIKQEHTYKPPVPKYNKEEILLQKSQENFKKKNFILSNAIDAALLNVPVKKKVILSTEKQGYGIVPKYLETVKKDIEKEYRVFQKNMRIMRGQPEPSESNKQNKEELIKIREGLKQKWSDVYEKYSKMAHKTKFDTLIEKEKKAGYEREMNALEVDIRKLRIAIQEASK